MIKQTKRRLKLKYQDLKKTNTEKYDFNKHTKSHKHTFHFQNIKILDADTNYLRRLTSEMVHININQPLAINKNEDTHKFSTHDKFLVEMLKNIKNG